MAQSRINILMDQPGQPLGAQFQAILQRENAYRVDVLAPARLNGTVSVEPRSGRAVRARTVRASEGSHPCRG